MSDILIIGGISLLVAVFLLLIASRSAIRFEHARHRCASKDANP